MILKKDFKNINRFKLYFELSKSFLDITNHKQ